MKILSLNFIEIRNFLTTTTTTKRTATKTINFVLFF